jgi:hypothetical protein
MNEVDKLALWLASEDSKADLEKLDDWLYGRGLPQDGRYNDPYRSFLTALEEAGVSKQYEVMARRLAAWFDRMPALSAQATVEEIIRLDTALLLAQHLHYPAPLTGALERLFRAQTEGGAKIAPGLEYQGIPLTRRLLDAVTANQIDKRFLSDWVKLAETDIKQEGFGPCRSALAGVCAMPANPKTPGERDVKAVAQVLAAAALSLENIEGRGKRFRQLIKFAEEKIEKSDGAELSKEILERHHLPHWAQVMLSSHVYFIVVGGRKCLAISEVYKNAFRKIDGFNNISVSLSEKRSAIIFELNENISDNIERVLSSSLGMSALESGVNKEVIDFISNECQKNSVGKLTSHILGTILENACEILHVTETEGERLRFVPFKEDVDVLYQNSEKFIDMINVSKIDFYELNQC